MSYKDVVHKKGEYHLFLDGALEVMSFLIEKNISVDLIIIDPPYNIKKAVWDKWKTVEDYVEFMGLVFIKCQRLLKDEGSFYFFHNDFLQIVELQNWLNVNSKFVFKQLIIWNKKFKGCRNEGFLQGFIEPEGLRNYQKMVEYILYYTFQYQTGLTTVKLDMNNFTSLRQYFKDFQEALGLTLNQINKKLGNRKAEHSFYWKSTQWDMPTKETYNELCKISLKYEFVRKEYEFVRKEYEELRKEYENLRYTFNNQKTHHSVWNYEIAKKQGHITPKPVELIENIILHSSNENDIILDCFMGSGTTGVACRNLNRRFIGIESNEPYFKSAVKRIVGRVSG